MSRQLSDLSPAVRPFVDAFLDLCAAADIDLLVTCTLRTQAEQATLFAQGRTAPGHVVTNARPGQSAHNYGLGVDVVPMVNGKPDWQGSDPIWKKIGELGQKAGLQWLGAPDSEFVEMAHFQHPTWRTVAGLD